MITKTTLQHPHTIEAIKRATVSCMNGHIVEHVNNRNGIPFLAIRVRNGKALVTDRFGRDLTKTIASLI